MEENVEGLFSLLFYSKNLFFNCTFMCVVVLNAENSGVFLLEDWANAFDFVWFSDRTVHLIPALNRIQSSFTVAGRVI